MLSDGIVSLLITNEQLKRLKSGFRPSFNKCRVFIFSCKTPSFCQTSSFFLRMNAGGLLNNVNVFKFLD